LLLVACSSGGGGARPTPSPVVTATTAAPTAAPTTAAPSATPSPSPTIVFTTEREYAHFSTPTGNIGCYATPTGVGCAIGQYDWTLPPKPRDCDADWGAGIDIGDGLANIGVCASDTSLGAERVLAYGTGVRIGVMECVSETRGVTCRNVRTRHGFFLSRASYRTF
jgi:hypothetical protein